MTDAKVFGFWVVGSIFIFLGSMIAGAVDPSALGATLPGIILSYLIAFFLILIGGMFWISAASYLSGEEEE